jgi:cobaltochelatase CobT
MLHTLRNALPIVAAALGRKLGVEVGVGGHDACTDGRRIQIPDVADDPTNRDLAWGYLAHEAAHVRYTDFAVYEQAAREGPLQEMLQNRIEDVRIERELGRPYPGTRATIAKVLRRMLAEGQMSAPKPTDHPAQVLAAYLLLALRHEVLNQRVLAEEAGKAAATLRQVFPVVFIGRLRSLMDKVPGLTSTAEAVDLARHIRRLIEEEVDPPSGNGSGETADPNDEDETDHTSGAGGSMDDDEPPANEKGRKPESNNQDTGEDGTQDGDELISNEEQDGRPDGSESQPDHGNGTDSLDTSELDRDAACISAGDADSTYPRDTLAAVRATSAGDFDDDLFAQVGKLLGTEASATNEVRLPLPEDYSGNALAGMRLLARVQAESARLSARLQGLVQASRMERPRPVRSGRCLDTRKLHRVAVADARIFARRSHRIAPNTAVHLLVEQPCDEAAPAAILPPHGETSPRAGTVSPLFQETHR